MEAVQRIRLIRIIEKMEKNPEFCNKFGIKNTSEYIAEKEPKKAYIRMSFRRGKNVIIIVYDLYDLVCRKIICFWVKSIWGIMKLLCTVIFFPVILIGMVLGGLMYIAFPLLIVGGIVALATSRS